MSPLVSIVIPTYNHETFIREAIESVVSQTYEPIELVVIDDNSKDSTYFVAKGILEHSGYKSRFVNLRVIRHEYNRGAHYTINEGIGLSEGEFVTVLNSDDYFSSRRIELILAEMLANVSELGFSGVRPVTATSQALEHFTLPPSLRDAFFYLNWARDVFPAISFAFLSRNVAISTGNIVCSKRLYDFIGGFRDFKYIHDWDFMLRACLVTEPVFVNEPLYNYRIHSTNSFSSLAAIGEDEVDQMTADFFSQFNRKVFNKKAPIPRLWPGCFETFEDELYLVRRAKSLGIRY